MNESAHPLYVALESLLAAVSAEAWTFSRMFNGDGTDIITAWILDRAG